MNVAAVKFCWVVSKKASDEGWKLSFSSRHFIWQKGNDESSRTGSPPVMRFMGPEHLKEMFHEACCHLERHLKWNLEVEV